MTFIDHGSTTGVSGAPLRHYNRAIRTIVSLQVSDYDSSSPNIGVSLALSSSYNHLISALVAIRSAQGFKTVIILLSKVLEGLVGALLAAVFQGIVAGVVVILGKFFRGCGLCVLWVLWVLFLVSVFWGSGLFLQVLSWFRWVVILYSQGSYFICVLGFSSWFCRYL